MKIPYKFKAKYAPNSKTECEDIKQTSNILEPF